MSRWSAAAVSVLVSLLLYVGWSYGSWNGLAPLQTGLASWYGQEEQGKLTANGETYDRRQFTAAHRHLPFNTVVRVTNQRNGRSVEVRINDRGPYAKGRILDLSEAAADTLDMKKAGVVPVRIEVVQPGGTDSSVTLP